MHAWVHHEHMKRVPQAADRGRLTAAAVGVAVVLAVVGPAVGAAYDRGTAMFADTLSFAVVVAAIAVVGAPSRFPVTALAGCCWRPPLPWASVRRLSRPVSTGW
jgi:hypothetical protein